MSENYLLLHFLDKWRVLYVLYWRFKEWYP